MPHDDLTYLDLEISQPRNLPFKAGGANSSPHLKGSNLKTRLWRVTIICTAVILWFHLRSWSKAPNLYIYESDVANLRLQEAYFMHFWARHVNTHPVMPYDRQGFAEMGFRTQLYARLLQSPTLTDFDFFEKVLWPFLPGIKRLRTSFTKSQGRQIERGERGIVLSVGRNGFTFANQFITIIREVYHCELPIELYYYGDSDLPSFMRLHLQQKFSGVRVIDLKELDIVDESITQLTHQGFALKPFALIATNFTEVILSDVDAVFLTNPEEFFEVKGYKETGTMFFHDRDHVREGPDKIIHSFMSDQLGQRGPSPRLQESMFWQKKGIFEQESGIVVLDKSRIEVFSALLFVAWQNAGAIRDKTTYRVFWGDKESFWLAFELARFPYYFVQNYAGAIGNENAEHEKGFCSEHPLHFIDIHHGVESSSGNLTHAVVPRLGKPAWFNGSLLDVKTLSSSRYLKANAWAMNGEWEFIAQSESWCIRNYTKGLMEDFGLGTKLRILTKAAMVAEKDTIALLELNSA